MTDRPRDNSRPPGKGGPKTAAGKAVTRGNGLRHGLRSKLLRAGVAPKVVHCPLRLRGCDCQERGVSLDDPCPALAAVRAGLARDVRAQRHLKPVHAFLVDLLLDDVVAVLQARLWLATVGLVRIEGNAITMQSLEADLGRRKQEIRRLSEALLLTPAAMHAAKLLDDALELNPLEAIRRRVVAAPEPEEEAGG